MAEKMRVHTLAKELNVPSKIIIEKCKAEGVTSVKNHMSTLSAGLHATICEWFTEGTHEGTIETAQRVDLEKVRLRTKAKKKAAEAALAKETSTPAPAEGGEVAVAVAPSQTPVAEAPVIEPAIPAEPPSDEPSESAEPAPADAATEPPPAREPVAPTEPQEETGAAAAAPGSTTAPPEPPKPVAPAGPQHVPRKVKLQGPRVVRYEAPERDAGPMGRPRRPPSAGGASPPLPTSPDTAERTASPTKEPARRKARINPRRAAGRLADAGDRIAEWRDQDLQERRERLAGATGRRIFRRRTAQKDDGGGPRPGDAGPKTDATVHEPIHMKEFCATTGLNFLQCFKVLRDEHDFVANINMVLPNETAELLALHFGINLVVVPAKTLLDELEEEFAARERTHEQLRPPVVAMLGHVDHGKTSLLDAIRNTQVASGEDGGITQHIGASYIQTEHGAVTFLDTPGHEAFTAMRARGAQMTDVVVLVVAADDGLMPQTIEAINHAKAANVSIVVALNKIDLGDQNKLKIFGQLAELGLAPSGDWGGDTDVIPTSATTGAGVAELLEHLAALGSLLTLKADPTLPAMGMVIEAETKPGVGAVARILVQEGTLHVGDVVVCGPASGKIRALVDDHSQRIQEAGPSMPVEAWGFDDVPAAGDKLYVVDRFQRAKSIAAQVREVRDSQSRIQTRKVKSLEEMFHQRDQDEVPELQVIIKADMDGSVTALRQAITSFPDDEVRLTIRHAGVGAVTDSDVLLAATCNGIVVAFRADVPAAVRRLADQHGVDVRQYRVIYDVRDDIKKALEGLLAPDEKIEPRATVEVRKLFRLSKKGGSIAGSYVVDGVVDRKHFARVVRDGVVVRDRCTLASLRRFKDDVKEVRAGMECGIKLEGFDDIHAGDRIETYEVIAVARTL